MNKNVKARYHMYIVQFHMNKNVKARYHMYIVQYSVSSSAQCCMETSFSCGQTQIEVLRHDKLFLVCGQDETIQCRRNMCWIRSQVLSYIVFIQEENTSEPFTKYLFYSVKSNSNKSQGFDGKQDGGLQLRPVTSSTDSKCLSRDKIDHWALSL